MKSRNPLWTFSIVGLAVIVWLNPSLTNSLIYDRAAILAGEFWRLWTGHLVHFSTSHFMLDLFAFVVCGSLLELRTNIGRAWLFLGTPLVVSLAMMVFVPNMARYGGLSALVVTALVSVALSFLREAVRLEVVEESTSPRGSRPPSGVASRASRVALFSPFSTRAWRTAPGAGAIPRTGSPTCNHTLREAARLRVVGWAVLGLFAVKTGYELSHATPLFANTPSVSVAPTSHLVGAAFAFLLWRIWKNPDRCAAAKTSPSSNEAGTMQFRNG